LRRALLVEDEIMVAMYVEDLLTELGYEVAALATSFEQALPLAREGHSTSPSSTSILAVS
jgi:DNA-binding response OmpR family regulator